MISAARRDDIVGALRRGTVPGSGLDALAVGIDAFAPTLDEELDAVAAGRGGFKAVRGEYGSGKTFFGRWLQERARARGFAASEVRARNAVRNLVTPHQRQALGPLARQLGAPLKARGFLFRQRDPQPCRQFQSRRGRHVTVVSTEGQRCLDVVVERTVEIAADGLGVRVVERAFRGRCGLDATQGERTHHVFARLGGALRDT